MRFQAVAEVDRSFRSELCRGSKLPLKFLGRCGLRKTGIETRLVELICSNGERNRSRKDDRAVYADWMKMRRVRRKSCFLRQPLGILMKDQPDWCCAHGGAVAQ